MKNIFTRLLLVSALAFSAASVSAAQIVVDGGFEDGSAWTQFSSNFGSPLCTLAFCGNGTGTGPNSGDSWAWFGGIGAVEIGSVSQSVVFDVGAAVLSFQFENIISDSSKDFIEFRVDGQTVWSYNGGGALDGVLGYTEILVNLDAFADGQAHTIEFYSEIFGINGAGSNFFVDDVSIMTTPVPVPAAVWLFVTALGGLGLFRRK